MKKFFKLNFRLVVQLFILTFSINASSAIQKKIIGRVEWVQIPELGLRFKGRVDTGAKTNSLHAEKIEEVVSGSVPHVKFSIINGNGQKLELLRPIASKQKIKSSTGAVTNRYVIREKVKLGNLTQEMNINLNSRTKMEFKFLLGRNALFGNFLVDVSKSHALGE